MIKLHDIVIAIFWAWLILAFVFVPWIGYFIAYGLVYVWDMYCKYRLDNNNGM